MLEMTDAQTCSQCHNVDTTSPTGVCMWCRFPEPKAPAVIEPVPINDTEKKHAKLLLHTASNWTEQRANKARRAKKIR